MKNKGKRYGVSGAQALKIENHLFMMCNVLQGSDERTLTLMPTRNVGEREGWVEGAFIK